MSNPAQEELDLNKIVSGFLTEFFNKNADRVLGTGKKLLTGATKTVADELRLHLLPVYKKYLTRVVEKYSKAKSFLIQHEPTLLEKFYVPLGISCGSNDCEQASINCLTSSNPFAVITGSGGSGKSMMMRYLFLDTLKEQSKVPVFIELRELNNSELTVKELISKTLTDNKFKLDAEFIERALKAGHFAIFLDGFDEISNIRRNKIAKEIQLLAENYEKNSFIVSSRADNEFSTWKDFSIWEIMPLTLEQACELVDKPAILFDKEFKQLFINDLKKELFTEHKSFLSNPLLLSIMFLTYRDNAEIPKKLSVFYQQAYQALFNQHDALKSGYKRERFSKLDVQDFAKVFSAFSLLTYDQRKLSFDETEALEFIQKAKNITGIEFEPQKFLHDAHQAVCLLVKEGFKFTFAHRSFQEYFTAKFIDNAESYHQTQLLDRFVENFNKDNVINLTHNINPNLVETHLFMPTLNVFQRGIGYAQESSLITYHRFLEYLIDSIELVKKYDQFRVWSRTKSHRFTSVYGYLLRTYCDRADLEWEDPFKYLTATDFRFLTSVGNKKDGTIIITNENIRNNKELAAVIGKIRAFTSYDSFSRFLDVTKMLTEKHKKTFITLEEIFKN